MNDLNALRAKWQRVAATNKDPSVQTRAAEVLASLGAQEATPAQPQELMPGPTGKLEAFARNAGEGFIPGLHNLMGVGNTIGEYLGGKLTDAPVKKDLDTAFMQEEGKPREDLAKAKQDHPWISVAGDVLGTGVGLLGAGAGRATRAITGAAENVAPKLAASRLGKVALGATTGAATGAGMEAVKSSAEGEDLAGVGRRVAGGAKGGAVFGSVLSSASQGAEAANAANLASTGGRARQIIEANGGKVGLMTPGSGGPFDKELAGLKPTGAGINAASRRSSANLLSREEEMLNKDLQPHLEAKSALDEGAGAANKVVVNDLRQKLVKLSTDGTLTDAQQARVKDWIDNRIEKWEVVTPGSGRTGVYAMPESELNKFRQMVGGQLPTDPAAVSERAMGKAGEATKAAVDETSYAGPNKGIHEARNRYEERRRMLSLPPRPKDAGVMAPEDARLPESEVAKVTNMLSRNEHDTSTVGARNSVGEVDGLGSGKRLDLYSKLVPEGFRDGAQRDINLPAVLNAKGDLSAQGFKDLKGGLLKAMPEVGGLVGVTAAAATHHPVIAGLAGLTALMARNSAPIQGRVLYNPLKLLPRGIRYPANPMLMEELYRQEMDRRKAEGQ